MIRAGLVSVTFRQLAVERIISLAAEAHLDGIEWGGDVHVRHGDTVAAAHAARATTEAGLAVAAYGSYYHVGESEAQGLPFATVLDTAIALGAPLIRVWAGARASADADQNYRDQVVGDSVRIAELAQAAGIEIAYEFHRRTLTDTGVSTCRLLTEVLGADTQSSGGRQAQPPANVSTYWQVDPAAGPAANATALEAVLPWLSNVHVFAWATDGKRRLLAGDSENWRGYLRQLTRSGKQHFALLEFVKNDDPDVFRPVSYTHLRAHET